MSKHQYAMVMELNKCLGCQTCTIACKKLWTDRRHRLHVLEQCRDSTRPRLSAPVGSYRRRLERRRASAQSFADDGRLRPSLGVQLRAASVRRKKAARDAVAGAEVWRQLGRRCRRNGRERELFLL